MKTGQDKDNKIEHSINCYEMSSDLTVTEPQKSER